MSAIFSPCGRYRYRLERQLSDTGIVLAYFGVNPSTASAEVEDHTTMKWRGFARVLGGVRKYIVGNAFAYRATDVRELAMPGGDPMGPDTLHHLQQIIADADLLVPCWGSRLKLPRSLRIQFDQMEGLLRRSGKPIRVFGLTKSGDPKHPLTLGYDTPLVTW